MNIGQTDHPMDWISTSPAHFRSSFKIRTSEIYPYKAQYDEDVVSPELERTARLQVRRTTTIGHDVWIGHGAIVIAGVSIGTGSVIGAGAVVTKDVEPYQVVGGVPARPIGTRFDSETVTALLESRWWEFAPWQMRHLDLSDVSAAVRGVHAMRERGESTYSPGWVHVGK